MTLVPTRAPDASCKSARSSSPHIYLCFEGTGASGVTLVTTRAPDASCKPGGSSSPTIAFVLEVQELRA